MSISEFISMNGYGFYVWWSFGMMAFLMFIELIGLKMNRKHIIGEVRKTARINQEQHESKK